MLQRVRETTGESFDGIVDDIGRYRERKTSVVNLFKDVKLELLNLLFRFFLFFKTIVITVLKFNNFAWIN